MKLKNFRAIFIAIIMCCLLLFNLSIAIAQKPDTAKIKTPASAPIIPKLAPDALKPYAEIIPTSAKTTIGFFKVHQVGEKYFLEIPDSLLGRELLAVNRISRSAADFRKPESRTVSYAGDLIGESVFHFTKGPANKLFLSISSYKDRSSDTSANGLSNSLFRSTMESISAAFMVKALNDKDKATVIDITDYLNGDNQVFGFSTAKKAIAGLTMPLADRSYIESIKAYPTNIEIKTVKTFQKQDGGLAPMMIFTFELNSSMVLLPKVPMKAREYDERVGYLSDNYTDFDQNPRGVKSIGNILRWRLIPKDADLEKYNKGELVEPQKPIIIYIDPATPKKWVPFLIQGINDWQAAFQKAGFKNAIIGKEAPVNDSTWNIDDARHNVLVYKPAGVASSNGDIIRDPRSGEILDVHISWYHNVINELYKSYFIQAGAVDVRAQTPQFKDDLMGQLIRNEVAKQIGNKLGLRFNAGASSAVPVAKLRNKAWIDANGHSPTIMDDASYNYVAQPEDHMNETELMSRIGDYDQWAIAWGYKLIPGNKSATEESEILSKWINIQLKLGKQYEFGAEPAQKDVISDPRNQQDDLGDNAILASTYGIKNLKRIVPNLMKWTRVPNENYDNAGEMYQASIDQYERYLQHVANTIGGIYTTAKMSDQTGVVYGFVSKEKQQNAMKFLQNEAFSTPYWLKNNNLYKVTYTSFNPVMAVQKNTLLMLLDARCLSKLIIVTTQQPTKSYSALQMLNELKQGIFSELEANKPITLIRRELQKAYVLKLSNMLQQGVGSDGELGTIVRAHGKNLLADVKKGSNNATQQVTKAHLQDMADRLYLALYNPSALPVPAPKRSNI